MRFNKSEREKYGISLEKMSELSGFTIERIKDVERIDSRLKWYFDAEKMLQADRDSEQMLAIVNRIKREQDKLVGEIVGRFISGGIGVSLTHVEEGANLLYQAKLSRLSRFGSSMSVVGRGRSPLSAMTSAIDMTREAVGLIAPLFPVAQAA